MENEDVGDDILISVATILICSITTHYSIKKRNIMMDPELNESRRKNILSLAMYKVIIIHSIFNVTFSFLWMIYLV